MNDSDSYASYPKSVAEARSLRSQNGADWTPRDALIDLLRQIDSGVAKPDALVICWSEPGDKAGEGFSTFSSAAPNGLAALGLLTRSIHRINMQMTRGSD